MADYLIVITNMRKNQLVNLIIPQSNYIVQALWLAQKPKLGSGPIRDEYLLYRVVISDFERDWKQGIWWPSKRPFGLVSGVDLTAESVQSLSLTFQGIDYVHGSDCLPLGMLGVSDCITDNILQEVLQDTSGLFVDQSADTFHTSSSSQTSDCWLSDALDVIS